MPANAVRLIRLVLSLAEQGAALECLELALAAARRAGARAVQDAQDLPPAEQLTLAIQAADEALVGLAVQLAEGDQDGEAQRFEKRGRSASPRAPPQGSRMKHSTRKKRGRGLASPTPPGSNMQAKGSS